MKRYLVLFILCMCLFLSGCGKKDNDNIIKEFKDKITSSENYTLAGNMKIVSNEKTYTYDVNVDFMTGDYYKVVLINKDNSHEQIILKNAEGVYVVTPSLNKSFKFQSQWPDNSSQVYILSSIIKDLDQSEERNVEFTNKKYVLTSSVNYPNNSNLVNQKVYLSEKLDLEKIEVYNMDAAIEITFEVVKLDLKTKHQKNYFTLSNNVVETNNNETQTTSSIDEIIYPMYIPNNTIFDNQEVVTTDDSQRVILTFKGEKPFIIVEETASVSKDLEVTSSTGDLVFYENILGSLTETSLTWHEDNMEYYIIGENLTNSELLQIAASTSTVAITK